MCNPHSPKRAAPAHSRPDADPGHRSPGILLMQQVVGPVSIHKDPDGSRVLLRHPHRLVTTTNAAVDILTSD